MTEISVGTTLSAVKAVAAALSAIVVSTALMAVYLYYFGHLIEGPRLHVRGVGEGIGLIVMALIFVGIPAAIITAVIVKLAQFIYLAYRSATIVTVLVFALSLALPFGYAYDDSGFGRFVVASFFGGISSAFVFFKLQTGRWY